MEKKNVGWLIIGISLLIVVIILLFNNAMNNLGATCTHYQSGYECPAHKAINQQTYLALAIVGILAIIGLVLIFSKPEEKIIIKKVKERVQKNRINENDFKDLRPEEKEILKLIREEGAVFQANLIEKTGFGKAKMSRILDKLEGRGFVERKRRGMTNVVVIKD